MKKIIFVLCALFSGVVFSQQNTAAITQVDPLQDLVNVNDTLKLSHLPRSMFKKRGVKVSHC